VSSWQGLLMMANETPQPGADGDQHKEPGECDAAQDAVPNHGEPQPQRQSVAQWVVRMSREIVLHEDFETVVLLAVAGNCLTLALHDPLQGDRSGRNRVLFWAGTWACASLGHLCGQALRPPYQIAPSWGVIARVSSWVCASASTPTAREGTVLQHAS
jgi:hypothetical protein